MSHRYRRRAARMVAVGLCAVFAQAALVFAESDLTGSVRTRYSAIDQDGNAGAAFSALLRLNLRSHWQDNWTTLLELDYVGRALRDQHSDGVTDNGQPVVPDTDGFDLNQFYLESNNDMAPWKLGRQRIEFDNQRFVGGNAFWQNEQTFDGLTVQTRLAASSLLQYAHVYNVNRIFGDDAGRSLSESDQRYDDLNGVRPAARLGDHRINANWLRAEWSEWDYQHFVGYAYFNDYLDFPELSHQQFGLRHQFDYKFDAWRLRTQLEYAHQHRDSVSGALPKSAVSVVYRLLDAALGYDAVEFGARYEVLDSQQGRSFITPLGSSHDFHGVVNKFSSTPEQGLLEKSARISWRQAPWLVELRQQRFSAAATGVDYGDETDLTLRWRRDRVHSFMLTSGRFQAASDSSFTDEWRIYLDYRFEF
ncbi:alginate export family protein [Permianibacter sp. IMCC34836]|uniref:alginate export family protein n=1 Tax=Permianibacter fluminis TaxID=2738515 RepID=UPI001557A892|nr:alginate export family protein [Permianibacter fluminis]NQD35967.1 alginate export family protein [Permianibacter fluminis]